MINLEMGTNVIALTLSENVTGNYKDGQFLFKFYSNATKATKYFLGTDLNNGNESEYRYNKFNIVLVPTEAEEDLNAGVIYLPNTGFYEYTIYAQLDPNIEPQPTDLEVEYGRVLYEFNEATITSFSPDIETIIYNG